MKNILISKSALIYNYKKIKQKSKAKICAVVKANAYGHGLEQVVKILGDKPAFYAVANLEEGLKLRKINKNVKILILGECENIKKAIKNKLSVTIYNYLQLKNNINLINLEKNNLFIHLKINSGMNRLGIKEISEFNKILKLIKKNKKIIFEGIFTHFATANFDNDFFELQKNKFNYFLHLIPDIFSPIVHIGGGDVLKYFNAYDMVRVGMRLYGYGDRNLKPVMKIQTKIIHINCVKENERVGYHNGFICDKKINVGIIPLGYADGISKKMSGEFVKVRNHSSEIIGNVCMDMTMLKLAPTDKIGDKVLVFEDANFWAEKQNISVYEILTRFNAFRGKRKIVK